MAEKNSIITLSRRTALAQLSAGTISTIAPIKYIALGDGGVNSDGDPVAPGIDQAALTHEVCRYAVQTPEFPVATTARFTVVVPEGEQDGVSFSEMALVDEQGELAAIKTMYVKRKDEDVEFTLTFDLEF